MQFRRPFFSLTIAFVLGAGVAETAGAQVFTPSYLSPQRSSDIGVYLNDGPGDFSVEGIMRRGFGEFDLGFRGGFADTDDVSVLVGLDYRNPVATGSPIALAVTGSAQAVLGEVSGAGLAAGLTVGPTVTSGNLTFTPYLHPGVGMVTGLAGDGWDLELLADIGIDLAFSGVVVRFGGAFDDVGADWGIGVAWR